VDLGEGSQVRSSLNDLVIMDVDKNDLRLISNNVNAVEAFFLQSKASRFQSLMSNGPDDILIMHDMKYWSMREIKSLPEEQVRVDIDLNRRVGCGFEHRAALGDDGKLVIFGNCYHGQRCLESEVAAEETVLDTDVIEMAVLGWATVYITKSKKLKVKGFLKYDIRLEELQSLLDTSCSKAKIMLAAGIHHIVASDGKRCVISTPKGWDVNPTDPFH